jgi:hypothetical protein
MARISTYSLDTSISAQDLLVGTDAEDSNISKNYKIENITTYIASQVATGTINKIPVFTAANAVGDSIMTQLAGTAISIFGNLNVTDIDCENVSALDITASGTTRLESNIIAALPSFADDAAASSLAQGRLYQTDGTGAAPLNVAGIVMRKQ